jgi:hypothetical protein
MAQSTRANSTGCDGISIVKVKVSLWNDMQAQGGSTGTAALMLNFCARW